MSELNIPESRLSRAAVIAFVLGVSSLALSLVTALPGLYAGLSAVRAINGSDGRLRGRRLAVAGLVLSAFTTLLTTLGFVALVLLYLQDRSHVAGCTNNLRQIGQAVNRYHVQHDHFPAGTVPNAALRPEQRLSWQAAILPVLSEGGPAGKKWEKLAGEVAFEQGWEAPANDNPRGTNVAPYLCPSFARDFSNGQKGLTSYVGVAGVGLNAAILPLQDPRCGFFGYDRTPTLEDISRGISETMMSVETMQDNGPWLAGGPSTVRGLDPDGEQYLGSGRPFAGLHRGGGNVLWIDGSVRFLNEGTSPSIFRASVRIHQDRPE